MHKRIHLLRKNFRRCSLLILFLSISFISYSQGFNASVQLDSSDFRIGDPIALTVNVDHPYGMVVDWTQNTPFQGNFEKLSESRVDSIRQKSFLTEKKVIVVTTFDTGRILTPEIEVRYHDQQGNAGSIITNQILIDVSLVKVDLKNSFHPIAPPLHASASHMLMYFLVAGSFLLLVLFFIYRRRKRRMAQMAEYTASIQPEETILTRLDKLEKDLSGRKVGVEQFYVKLTDLLREHIEKEFAFPAPEHTSAEIIRYMKQQIEDPELLEKIRESFELADLVKFAKVLPSKKENQEVIKSTFDFVTKTGSEVLQTQDDGI